MTDAFELLTLPELIAANPDSLYSITDAQTKANADERLEAEADLLTARRDWSRAIEAYNSLEHPTWRAQEKLAYCLFRHGENEQAIKILLNGGVKQSSMARCIHIYCLLEGRQWVPEEIKPKIKQLLTLALSEPDKAPIAAFNALNILYGTTTDDLEQRYVWLSRAIVLHPKSEVVLSAYANLMLAHPYEPFEDVSQRLSEAIQDRSTSTFVWLAYIVSLRARTDSKYQTLEALRKRVDTKNGRWLSLAVAEELSQAGNWDAADELYLNVKLGGPETTNRIKSDRLDWQIVAFACRGRLAIALSEKDDALVEQRALEFMNVARQMPEQWRYGSSEILAGHPHPFWIGEEMLTYQPWFDLLPHRNRILTAVNSADTRGFLRLLWLQFDRDENGELTSEGTRQAEIASLESDDPIFNEIRYEIAQKKGDWLAAGEAWANFELHRTRNKDKLGESVHIGLPDNPKKKQTRDFAKGFRSAIQQTTAKSDLEIMSLIYSDSLRQPLLDHKLHDDFLQILVDLGASGNPDLAFDYGLANHLLDRHNEAKSAYWSLAPNMPQVAIKNLLKIASIQRSDTDMARLEQLVVDQINTADDARRSSLESLAQNITESRKALSRDPIIIKKAAISLELSRYPNVAQVTHIAELSFEEALTLVSLFRACGDLQQDFTLEPFGRLEIPFAPESHDTQGVFTLMSKGLISVSTDTTSDAFSISNGEIGYLFDRIRWLITAEALDFIDQIEQIASSGMWPERWFIEAPGVVTAFAMSECLTYMAYCAEERKMQAPQGEKTRFVIANVLRDHSVAQAYCLIWRSAANAADYYVRSGVPKAQAANSIVTRLQTLADRARAEGWEVASYGRGKVCPRSQMSHVLYDMFLKVGERGFRDCLATIELPSGDYVA